MNIQCDSKPQQALLNTLTAYFGDRDDRPAHGARYAVDIRAMATTPTK